jgi:hypothetical protein
VPLICLNQDARQFAYANPAARWAGANVLLLIVDHAETVIPALSAMFSRMHSEPPSAVTLRGRTLKVISVVIGENLSPSPQIR